MRKKLKVLPIILVLLLIVVMLIKKKMQTHKLKAIEIFDAKIYTDKEFLCTKNVCTTRDGSVKVISNKDGFIAYIKDAKIRVEVPVKYIIIEINGKIYYRKVKKNEKLRLLKEFSLYGNRKYEVKLENGLKGEYPILFSTGNSTYIEIVSEEEGRLIFKKYL